MYVGRSSGGGGGGGGGVENMMKVLHLVLRLRHLWAGSRVPAGQFGGITHVREAAGTPDLKVDSDSRAAKREEGRGGKKGANMMTLSA